MLNQFLTKKLSHTTMVNNRRDENIGFIDDDRVYAVDEIIELMHRAYASGLSAGRDEKADAIKKLLKL